MEQKKSNQKDIEKNNTQFIAYGESYSGPIPPPHYLAKYEEICPGSADRILSMAEKQSSHRRKLEEKVVSSNVMKEYIGMILAFIIAFSILFISYSLLSSGKTIQGFSVFVPLLLMLAGSFTLYKRK